MALPPLNAIRSFEAAARHLSFTKAATELCVTPGAVSRAVAGLEARLQVALFRQHKRHLQLTPAGKAYWFEVSQVLERLSLATDELQQYQGEGGLLVIGALPTLASRWLIPKLPDFQQRYPAIAVEIKSLPSDFSKSFTELDFERYCVDIALYVGEYHSPGLHQEHLFQERLLPVTAPHRKQWLDALVDRNNEATRYLLLHLTRPSVWYAWFEKHSMSVGKPRWRARFEHYFMLIDAAIAGLGVALLPECLIQQELEFGQLITANNTALEQPQQYCLLHHHIRHDEDKIRCFRQWLLAITGDIAPTP